VRCVRRVRRVRRMRRVRCVRCEVWRIGVFYSQDFTLELGSCSKIYSKVLDLLEFTILLGGIRGLGALTVHIC
jgi:hypothetical protein